jgi:protein-S-isoprenylcysteine O-methyltransferase Ste14
VPFVLRSIIPALWIAWWVYWVIAARDVKATRWRESPLSRLLHLAPLALAVLLLIARPYQLPLLTERFLPRGPQLPALGAVVVAAGLGLAIWARRHLGRNWSSTVTLKDDHALIRSGPYASVRHPIYSGLLLAFLGTAVAVGEWRGLVALGLAFLALLRKSRVEEQRMREAFPGYDAYCRTTAALIPFVF